MESSQPILYHETNIIIYGIGACIVSITLIALIRNLFCRKANDADVYSKKSRYNSRSYADYSRSKNSSINKSPSNDFHGNYSNSMFKRSNSALRRQQQQFHKNKQQYMDSKNNEKDTTNMTSNTSTISTNITRTATTTTTTTTTIPSNISTISSNTNKLAINNNNDNNKTHCKHQASQESFSNVSNTNSNDNNTTPTPMETHQKTSPIPQFTPFCEQHIAETNAIIINLPDNTDNNIDTDLDDDKDEKYDTDGMGTEIETDLETDIDVNIDPEKESINNQNKLSMNIIPKLSNHESTNNSDKATKTTHSRRQMSMSLSLSNFKLPKMPSITARPISVLKKVLRRMEYGQYDSKDIHLLIRTTSLFGCIGFALSLIIITIYYSLYLDRNSSWNIYLIYISIILYGISKFAIYSCALCRLYHTFSNSALQYSYYVYIIIICILFLHLIISLTFCVCIYKQWSFLSIYCGVAFFIFDILFILILYILFTKRMFELFENTSSYIAKSRAMAYHDKYRSGTMNQSSFDFSGEIHETSVISPGGSINKSQDKSNDNKDLIIPPIPSPANTPRNKSNDVIINDVVNDSINTGGIEYAVNKYNNLSIQIEEIQEVQDSDIGDNALSPISLKSPSQRLVITKSYSADMVELTPKLTPKNSNSANNKTITRSRGVSLSMGRGRTDSLSGIGRECQREQHRENSQSKRELSRIKRERIKNYKREKWKYYQKQQASGIEYVTRYTVLILLTSISSLSMAATLIYEQQQNIDNFVNNIHDITEFHIIFTLDITINCISIYFYFIFGKWLYHLSCCLCHSFIQSFCVSLCI